MDITAILDMPSGTHGWMAITCRHKISDVYILHTHMGQQKYESKRLSLFSVPTWQEIVTTRYTHYQCLALVHCNHKKKTQEERESMPSSSAEIAETLSYDAAHTAPFTRIHWRPRRHDYNTLKKEAFNLASKVDNLTFAWSWDPTTGEEYGLLAEIIGKV